MALGTFFPSSCLLNLGGGAYSWCPPWQAMTGVEHIGLRMCVQNQSVTGECDRERQLLQGPATSSGLVKCFCLFSGDPGSHGL